MGKQACNQQQESDIYQIQVHSILLKLLPNKSGGELGTSDVHYCVIIHFPEHIVELLFYKLNPIIENIKAMFIYINSYTNCVVTSSTLNIFTLCHYLNYLHRFFCRLLYSLFF